MKVSLSLTPSLREWVGLGPETKAKKTNCSSKNKTNINMRKNEKEAPKMREKEVKARKTSITHKGTKMTKSPLLNKSLTGMTMWDNSQVCA